MKKITIGYFADGKWGYETLKKIVLKKNILINFVCVRYKKPDKQILDYCKKKKLKLLKFKNINSKKSFQMIHKFKCDLLVSMSYNQIFGRSYQKFFPRKIINCHAGSLPFYRGRNILNWALINGEKKFGITVHFVDKGIDTGDIIIQKKYKISKLDDYKSLLNKCYKECPKLVLISIDKFRLRNYKAIKQNDIDKKGSYFKKRKIGDEMINWSQNSNKIHNFVRALVDPGPFAQTFYKNRRIFIHKLEILKKYSFKKSKSGTIVDLGRNKSLVVKTNDGFVLIKKYYPKINFKKMGMFK